MNALLTHFIHTLNLLYTHKVIKGTTQEPNKVICNTWLFIFNQKNKTVVTIFTLHDNHIFFNFYYFKEVIIMLSIMPFSRNETNLFHFLDNMEEGFLSDIPENTVQCRTDIEEKDNAFLITSDLPGFDKSEISVNVSDNVLTIKAEHKEEDKEETKNYIRKERRYGSYQRSFNVEDVNVEEIKADYKNGVLTLSLPKIAPVEPKKIEVSISE